MSDALTTEELQAGIRQTHGCGSIFLKSVSVTETRDERILWAGEVQVFALLNHPTAYTAYVWSHTIEGSAKRQVRAVLHEGLVKSPAAAVLAVVALRDPPRLPPNREA